MGHVQLMGSAPSCAKPSQQPDYWTRTSASPPTSGPAPASPPPRKPYVTELLEGRQGPAIAATDYVRAFANQIREYVPMKYTVLGTDGFGRSDTRANLRRHFEVDRYYIAHAAIAALAAEGKMTAKDVARAIKQYKIDSEKPNPIGV